MYLTTARYSSVIKIDNQQFHVEPVGNESSQQFYNDRTLFGNLLRLCLGGIL